MNISTNIHHVEKVVVRDVNDKLSNGTHTVDVEFHTADGKVSIVAFGVNGKSVEVVQK